MVVLGVNSGLTVNEINWRIIFDVQSTEIQIVESIKEHNCKTHRTKTFISQCFQYRNAQMH